MLHGTMGYSYPADFPAPSMKRDRWVDRRFTPEPTIKEVAYLSDEADEKLTTKTKNPATLMDPDST